MKSATFLFLGLFVSAVSAFGGFTPVAHRQTATKPSTLTMRARICDLLGKRPNRQARVVTFSHTRNKKVQHVNLQNKRYYSDNLKRNVRLRLSTKGIKTVNKYGSIDAAAKAKGVDISKF
eukprot:CAMPEP_0194299150 /NCGR_PEP_ID=MMETSP0169-20130528/60559_1 /TAXON_ID=218684 /ORGANISM="Corethron pennatum, Strain L29A3" /LENGTH=119 /DNA_ID=CAMNT_0039049221 /DNA_START=596 /DNA_END=955 /DNA_ORIENTATION=+